MKKLVVGERITNFLNPVTVWMFVPVAAILLLLFSLGVIIVQNIPRGGDGLVMWSMCAKPTLIYFVFAIVYSIIFKVVPKMTVLYYIRNEQWHFPAKFEEDTLVFRRQFNKLVKKFCCTIDSFDVATDHVRMTARPITVNPKVREIHYSVSFFTKGSLQNVKNLLDKLSVSQRQSAGELIQFHLFNFQEQFSKELAEFFNPLDEEQQRKLSVLVGAFLRPHLANSGITIQSVRFSL